jgi:hypothetical protein
MASRKGFGTAQSGENVEGYGAKKGRSGLDPRFNTEIKDDTFSPDWNSPLNMANPKDPLIDPDEGADIQMMSKMGMPPNPLGIENIEITKLAPERSSNVGRTRGGRGR